MELLLFAAASFVVFSNGANDNFKGFATVWGSQTLSYRKALALGTAATVAGSIASLFLAEALVRQFSGQGFVPDAVAASPSFIFSVAAGAAMTIFAATRAGLPVSTTHALIGGLIGAGLARSAAEVHYGGLAGSLMVPLLVSPILAAALGIVAYRVLPIGREEKDCACVVQPSLAVGSGAAALSTATPIIVLASNAQCDALPAPAVRLSVSRIADRLHTLSAAMICFARAVNDTPKLAALLLVTPLVNPAWSTVIIAAVMAAGGLAYARRVAVTMSQRVTRIDHRRGLTANLITAGLVLAASKWGMPVSTTHVAVGAIAGVGAGANQLHWPTIRNIALSWLATLPIAGALAWLTATVVS